MMNYYRSIILTLSLLVFSDSSSFAVYEKTEGEAINLIPTHRRGYFPADDSNIQVKTIRSDDGDAPVCMRSDYECRYNSSRGKVYYVKKDQSETGQTFPFIIFIRKLLSLLNI